MPVRACPHNGKFAIGNGPCMYVSRESAQKAYRAFLAKGKENRAQEGAPVWTTIDAVPVDVRMHGGVPLSLEQANTLRSLYDFLLSGGLATAEAVEGAWRAFEQRFRVSGKTWVESAPAETPLLVDMGEVVLRSAFQEGQEHFLEHLVGSAATDTFNTYIPPHTMPVYRAQAAAGDTRLLMSHNVAEPFPIGRSVCTIPADQWDKFTWDEVREKTGAEDPNHVLVYRFRLRENHPYFPILLEDTAAGVPFAASVGLLGVTRANIEVVGRGGVRQALIGPRPRMEHVALLWPGTASNPDANKGFVAVASRDLFAGVPVERIELRAAAGTPTLEPASWASTLVAEPAPEPLSGAALFLQRYNRRAGRDLFEAQVDCLAESLRDTMWRHVETGQPGMEEKVRQILGAFGDVVTRTVLSDSALRQKANLAQYLGLETRDNTETGEEDPVTKDDLLALIRGMSEEERSEVAAALAATDGTPATDGAEAAPEGAETTATAGEPTNPPMDSNDGAAADTSADGGDLPAQPEAVAAATPAEGAEAPITRADLETFATQLRSEVTEGIAAGFEVLLGSAGAGTTPATPGVTTQTVPHASEARAREPRTIAGAQEPEPGPTIADVVREKGQEAGRDLIRARIEESLLRRDVSGA